ncbi:3-hydroxymyristoyl/3-hydroxydecanoyl-(acyl carrier protein) dehydratase [Mucilaginibacter lappiensis]|jgi:3-hydroxymyristoyl/3-hydroxydecanoyl-(acyl carrier protein) dehydratase
MDFMDNLMGVAPEDVLVHGPKKILLNKYHWHQPGVGIIASYSPTTVDVEDHFGIFRGVDQIEAFAQATIVSCSAYAECIKQQCTFNHLKQTFNPLFVSIGQVNFRGYLQPGDVFISMGLITFYKFRQMTCDGRIYKVPKGLDVDNYFGNYTKEKLLKYDLEDGFTLIAELFDVTGRGIKKQ